MLLSVIAPILEQSGREHIGEGGRRGFRSNLMPDLKAGHRTQSGATSSSVIAAILTQASPRNSHAVRQNEELGSRSPTP
ncbi:hypothetical protein NMY22_g14180 [Coprinellus aureogranulatus]|nr:hypothetical protein NMY22_g14180 [Coprinellus aureogranulatus]